MLINESVDSATSNGRTSLGAIIMIFDIYKLQVRRKAETVKGIFNLFFVHLPRV